MEEKDKDKLVEDEKPSGWMERSKAYIKYVESNNYWFALGSLSLAALLTRLSYLQLPPGTVWDEVHFGKFASHYIRRDYYHDVHPPLGKIMVAAACYLTGYQGNFNFSMGLLYDDSINYHMVRMEMALLGAALVPLGFLTVYELTRSVGASALGALAILCDTFIHRLNTLILLDPPLIFTISFAVFSVLRFYNMRNREWSSSWWLWLCLTGFSLGVVMSIKYVGVFTVLFVGVHTAHQLLFMCADKDTPPWEVLPHFLARVLCLILLPIAVYVFSFWLHFTILFNSSPLAGSWVHSRYFAHFNNTEFNNAKFPKYVNYGANVTLQNSGPNLGYLDTWYDLFPSEITAPCQVTSVTPLRDDEGSDWRLRKVLLETGQIHDALGPTEPPILVRNGDHIMLTNPGTMRSLRSHSRRAAITKSLYQVCAYGDDGVGGPFETWKVIIPGAPEGEPLQVFAHDFYLKHYQMNCYLKAIDVHLPHAWASVGSKEIACTKNQHHENTLWHVNWIKSDKLVGETTAAEHKMSFWERLIFLHRQMINLNAGLGGDKNPNKDEMEDQITTSRPWKWPICFQHQMFAGYEKNETVGLTAPHTYSLGAFNPIVAYINLIAFATLFIITILHFFWLLRDPEEKEETKERRGNFMYCSFWLVTCWALHYLPFYFMNRALYLHHYCPSYLYSCMLTGAVINYVSDATSDYLHKIFPKMSKKSVKSELVCVPAFLFIASYVILFPLATYIENPVLERSERLSLVLDRVFFGQQWHEFGYRDDLFREYRGKTVVALEETNFDNPFVNASLYYTTDLNNTRPQEEEFERLEISPVAATNYTAWHDNLPKQEVGEEPLSKNFKTEAGHTDPVSQGVSDAVS